MDKTSLVRQYYPWYTGTELHTDQGGYTVNYLSGIGGFLSFVQLFFAIVIGLYFLNLLKAQKGNKVAVERESRKEMDKAAASAPTEPD